MREKNILDRLIGYGDLEKIYRKDKELLNLIRRKEIIELSNVVFNLNYHEYRSYYIAVEKFFNLIKLM